MPTSKPVGEFGYPSSRSHGVYSPWRLIKCPRCAAPARHPCVRVGTTELVLSQPHTARVRKARATAKR